MGDFITRKLAIDDKTQHLQSHSKIYKIQNQEVNLVLQRTKFREIKKDQKADKQPKQETACRLPEGSGPFIRRKRSKSRSSSSSHLWDSEATIIIPSLVLSLLFHVLYWSISVYSMWCFFVVVHPKLNIVVIMRKVLVCVGGRKSLWNLRDPNPHILRRKWHCIVVVSLSAVIFCFHKW